MGNRAGKTTSSTGKEQARKDKSCCHGRKGQEKAGGWQARVGRGASLHPDALQPGLLQMRNWNI